MTLQDLLKRTTYNIEHPKCKRCGKEVYIPKMPKLEIEKMSCFSWACFIWAYLKFELHWFVLDDGCHSIICPDCVKSEDKKDEVRLNVTDKWLESYREWRIQNNK